MTILSFSITSRRTKSIFSCEWMLLVFFISLVFYCSTCWSLITCSVVVLNRRLCWPNLWMNKFTNLTFCQKFFAFYYITILSIRFLYSLISYVVFKNYSLNLDLIFTVHYITNILKNTFMKILYLILNVWIRLQSNYFIYQ